MSGQATLTSANAAAMADWNRHVAETVGRRAVSNLNRGMSNSAVLIDAVDNFGFLTIHQITSLWTWITTEGGGCERQLRALEAQTHERQREVDRAQGLHSWATRFGVVDVYREREEAEWERLSGVLREPPIW